METRALGGQGLRVSQVGLGCMGMTGVYGTPDANEAILAIQRALDLGVTLLDTAELYGAGENERLVGRALQGRRDDVVLATKFGYTFDRDGRPTGLDSRPDHIRAVCDASLQRLGVDHIDLFYQHRCDPTVPIEEVVGVMADLVREGKVRYLGLSEAGPQTIRRAHAVHPISALQTEYSLWERSVEERILPTLRELGIGFVPYSPLGRGFLTGQIRRFEDLSEDDIRRNMPRFQGENFTKNLELVEQVRQIAREKGVTPGQIALAWLLHQGNDIVPIPGTKRRTYLEENVAAVDMMLTPADLARLEAVAPVGVTAGERLGAQGMRDVER